MSKKDECTVKTTFNGEKVEYLVPTVILVDSLVAMTPKDIQDETELSGSMSASAIAKTNNAIIKRITNFITDANIIIIIINHITSTIAMGPGTGKPALNFLGQNEATIIFSHPLLAGNNNIVSKNLYCQCRHCRLPQSSE